jgi:acetyl esterase/lipase
MTDISFHTPAQRQFLVLESMFSTLGRYQWSILSAVRHTLVPVVGLVLAIMITTMMSANGSEPVASRVKIWPKGAPFDEGGKQSAEVELLISQPAKPNGTTIIICPGGAYQSFCVDTEGYNVAAWLNTHGITTAILKYRMPAGRCAVPLSDAQRAIRWVRANAKPLKISSDRIGIIGFSAGGHLASTAGTHFDLGNKTSIDPVAKVSCRPDFMALIYPVITMGEKTHGGSRASLLGGSPTPEQILFYSSELQITEQTPPAFIAHATDDSLVSVENSRMFHAAMLAKKRSSELMELASGNHGLDRQSGPAWVAMQNRLQLWLAARHLISAIKTNS